MTSYVSQSGSCDKRQETKQQLLLLCGQVGSRPVMLEMQCTCYQIKWSTHFEARVQSSDLAQGGHITKKKRTRSS